MFSKREEPHAPNDIAEETGNGELNCVDRTDIQEDSLALLVGLPSGKFILDNSLGQVIHVHAVLTESYIMRYQEKGSLESCDRGLACVIT